MPGLTGVDLLYMAGLTFTWPYWAYLLLSSSKHRGGMAEKFGRLEPRPGDAPCVWIHGVSVGEILSVQPLVSEIRRRMPDCELVLSTTTQTGRSVAQQTYPGLRIIHFPFDFSWLIEKAFRLMRPACVLLAEGELWPNFLLVAARRGLPVAVVNGRLSEKSLRGYSMLRCILRRSFPEVGLWCVQSPREAEKVRCLGVPHEALIVTGNLKYDRLFAGEAKPPPGELITVLQGSRVVVAGSTHPGEDEAVLWVFERLIRDFPDVRLVLAPRHPERWDEVAGLIAGSGFEPARRTALSQATRPIGPKQVLLLDTMGELNSVYSLAYLVFIGGSMAKVGGHNVLEPAAAGKPTLFGPHMFKSADLAEDIQLGGGGFMVNDREELLAKCAEFFSSPDLAAQVGERAKAVVEQNRGAARRTFDALAPLLRKSLARAQGV